MIDYARFPVPKDFDETNLFDLNDLLNDFGIEFKYQHDDDINYNYKNLIINIDTKKLHRIKNRNAGRDKKLTDNFCRISDVLVMKETMSEQDILDTLKISRSTYYRRLKNIDENTNLNNYF